jgi:hypothetical protein
MIAARQFDETEFVELRQATDRLVHDAIEWAKDEAFPPIEALYEHVFYEAKEAMAQ